MANVDKIIKSFRASKFGHTFDECKKVLEEYGYIETSSRGSHHKFNKQGILRPFILAKHRPIDPAAINEILDIIDNEV